MPLAFFDFDGTLVSGNVVNRISGMPAARAAARKIRRDSCAVAQTHRSHSRELFNHVFFRGIGGSTKGGCGRRRNLYAEYVRSHLYEGVGAAQT